MVIFFYLVGCDRFPRGPLELCVLSRIVRTYRYLLFAMITRTFTDLVKGLYSQSSFG